MANFDAAHGGMKDRDILVSFTDNNQFKNPNSGKTTFFVTERLFNNETDPNKQDPHPTLNNGVRTKDGSYAYQNQAITESQLDMIKGLSKDIPREVKGKDGTVHTVHNYLINATIATKMVQRANPDKEGEMMSVRQTYAILPSKDAEKQERFPVTKGKSTFTKKSLDAYFKCVEEARELNKNKQAEKAAVPEAENEQVAEMEVSAEMGA